MQIVYISKRPKVLAETLVHVARFMPFVDTALVMVPDEEESQFLFDAIESISVTMVKESSVLSDDERTLLDSLDHQRRNYLLRKRLIESSTVDSHFIMSDDDARPLKSVTPELYIKEGKHVGYYFYDLRLWRSYQTDFDAGQIATGSLLQYHNLPTLSFASHMPQIIDRDIYNEASRYFSGQDKIHPLCEWSTYFNFALSKYAQNFHPPKPYLTLCWPEHPLAWSQYVQQDDYVFENYTPSNYRHKGPFSALNGRKSDDEVVADNLNKVILWRKHTILSKHPEQRTGIAKYLHMRTWVNKLFRNFE